jgi:hypothetical protein
MRHTLATLRDEPLSGPVSETSQYKPNWGARQRHVAAPPNRTGEARQAKFREKCRGEHSAKPEFVAEELDRLWPSLPKIELFRRGQALAGWAAFGNEANAASDRAPPIKEELPLSLPEPAVNEAPELARISPR